jgi:hypothetical protein
VLEAVVLVLMVKAVLVVVTGIVKVLASVETMELTMVVVLVAVLTSTAMFEVIVVLASVEGRESPTAHPSLGDSM